MKTIHTFNHTNDYDITVNVSIIDDDGKIIIETKDDKTFNNVDSLSFITHLIFLARLGAHEYNNHHKTLEYELKDAFYALNDYEDKLIKSILIETK